jgi:hypothetical protein
MKSRRATRDPLIFQRIAWGGIRYQRPPRPWTLTRLRKMVRDAVQETPHHGIDWPWNLENAGPWSPGKPATPEIVREYKRMAGWIRNASDHPLCLRFLRKTQSGNGNGSPYTSACTWDIASAWQSPSQFGRWLFKVQRRANRILRPWGLCASWFAISQRIQPQRPHKAAVIVAAMTLQHTMFRALDDCPSRWTYRVARDYLIEHPRALGEVIDVVLALRGVN